MADVEVLSAFDWGTLRSTGTSLDVVDISGDMDGSSEYLVIAHGYYAGSSTNGMSYYMRHARVDAPTSYKQAHWEPMSTTLYMPGWGAIDRGTSDGSDGAKINLYESASSTARGVDFGIMAINLDDLVENTDFWYASDFNWGAHTTTMTARASVTPTLVEGEDYLILAHAYYSVNSVTKNLEQEIALDGTRIGGFHSREGEDTNEFGTHLSVAVIQGASAGAQTIALRSRDDATGTYNQYNDSYLFVLRLGAFANHTIDGPNDNTSPTASTWNQLCTVTHTPAATGNTIVIAATSKTGGAYYSRARLQADNVDAKADYGDRIDSSDTTNVSHQVTLHAESVDTGGTTFDYDLDPSNAAVDYNDAVLVAFSVALAGGATDDEATPSTVITSTTIPAPTVTGTQAATATPATVVTTVTIPAPTASGQTDATTEPATITATAAIPAPATGAGATITGTTVAATTTLPPPTTGAGTGLTAATVAATVTIPAPTVTYGAAVTPATIVCTAGIPAPTTSAGAATEPITATNFLTIFAPTVTYGADPAPSTVVAAVTTPAPTVGGGTDTAPSTVTATVATPAPTVTYGADPAPSTITATTAIPAASAGAGATLAPAATATTITIHAPTINYGADPAPSTVAATITIPAPTLGAGTATAPATTALTTTTPAPTLEAGSGTEPAATTLTVTTPAPTTSTSTDTAPTTVTLAVTIPTATPHGGTVTELAIEWDTQLGVATTWTTGIGTSTTWTTGIGTSTEWDTQIGTLTAWTTNIGVTTAWTTQGLE